MLRPYKPSCQETGYPPIFLELRILKDLRAAVLATAHSKGVTGRNRGTAHSKALRRGGSCPFAVERSTRTEDSPHDTPWEAQLEAWGKGLQGLKLK